MADGTHETLGFAAFG